MGMVLIDLDPADADLARRLADVLYQEGVGIDDDTAIRCARRLNGVDLIERSDPLALANLNRA